MSEGWAVTPDGGLDGVLGVLWVFDPWLGVGGPSGWLELGSALFPVRGCGLTGRSAPCAVLGWQESGTDTCCWL